MSKKTRILATIFALLLVIAPFARSNPLDEDCVIVATEANARLRTSAVWSQILLVEFVDIKEAIVLGHALAVWQIHKGGAILVYDRFGTKELETHSQKPIDIAAALNKLDPLQPIFEAHFIK